jgi:hypothetical protein
MARAVIYGSRHKYGCRLTESTCSVCGKQFMRSEAHVYKFGRAMQCSYTCYRKLEEVERQKFREKLDKKIAMIDYVESRKNAFYQSKQSEKPTPTAPVSKQEKQLAGALESAIKEVEACEAWVHVFTGRVNRYPSGSAERRRAQTLATKWRKKLSAAQQAVDRLNEELEAKKNVHTSEKKAAGGHG